MRNLLYVRDAIRNAGGSKKLWIRTPLIPDATDLPDNLAAIGSFLASELDGSVERWELCAFNNLCRDKYRRLGLDWQFDQTQLYTQSQLDERYDLGSGKPFPTRKNHRQRCNPGDNQKLEDRMNLFTEQDIRDLDVELKVGILATVNPQGEPHLTMLSSIRPYAPDKLVWGQFTEGLSKGYVLDNPKCGFLIMSLDKQLWMGKARYTHKSKQGPEMENYNNLAMFRYNAYFGVHTAYYMDLVNQSGRMALPMGNVIFAAIKTILARTLGKKNTQPKVLNPWNPMAYSTNSINLKFISYVDADGFPVVLPVIQTQALDANRVVFSLGSILERELRKIPAGVRMAVFGMSFSMETVPCAGTSQAFSQ